MIEELLRDIHKELESKQIDQQTEQRFIESVLDKIYQFLYKSGQPIHTLGLGILRGSTFDMFYRGRILDQYAQLFGAMSYDTTIAGKACELYKKDGQPFLHLYSKKQINAKFTEASNELKKAGLLEEAEALKKRANTTIDQGIGSFLLIPITFGKEVVGIFTLSSVKETTSDKILGQKIEEKFIPIAQMLGLILFMEKISYDKAEEMSRLLISSIDAKDEYQATHSLNVRTMIDMFIDELSRDKSLRERVESIGFKLTVDKIESLRLAALLHDMGKVFIPSSILRKSSLNSEEMLIRKMHSYCTYNILAKSKTLGNIANMASMHHARYYIPVDVEGLDEYAKVETSCVCYPFDLFSHDGFLPESQIIALADTFNAIIRSRPEGKGLSLQQAIEIIENDESKFHGGLKDIFLTIVKRVEQNLSKGIYPPKLAEEYRYALWLDTPKENKKETKNKLKDLKQYLQKINFNNLGVLFLMHINEVHDLLKKDIKINKKSVKVFKIDDDHVVFALINIPKEEGFIWIKHVFDYFKHLSLTHKLAFSLITNSGYDASIEQICQSLINGLDTIRNEPVHYYLQPEMFRCI
jgi:HD-GYP domain-containing protein (c-di-GMP phosphodiesterase class II)